MKRLAALLLFLPSLTTAQPALSAAEVLQAVSRSVTPEVQFREVRTTRLLKVPLVSSGVLRYAPPDRLQRETLLPVRETVTIEGPQVTIDRDGVQSVVALVGGSGPAALVDTLRAMLGGNTQQLEALYRTRAEGSIEQWTLVLEPKATDTSLREIRVSGRSGTVDQIDVLERGGDRTVTALTR